MAENDDIITCPVPMLRATRKRRRYENQYLKFDVSGHAHTSAIARTDLSSCAEHTDAEALVIEDQLQEDEFHNTTCLPSASGETSQSESDIDHDAALKNSHCRISREAWDNQGKDYFFEALKMHGKEFEAVSKYITQKSRNRCTKNIDQVRNFYYNTWSKLSQNVKLDDIGKAPREARELFMLINYGEWRRKTGLKSLPTVHIGAFRSLVLKGITSVRISSMRNSKKPGKKSTTIVKIRTPVCATLKKWIEPSEILPNRSSVPNNISVELYPSRFYDKNWVLFVQQNPFLRAFLTPQTTVKSMLMFMQSKWSKKKLDDDGYIIPRITIVPQMPSALTSLKLIPYGESTGGIPQLSLQWCAKMHNSDELDDVDDRLLMTSPCAIKPPCVIGSPEVPIPNTIYSSSSKADDPVDNATVVCDFDKICPTTTTTTVPHVQTWSSEDTTGTSAGHETSNASITLDRKVVTNGITVESAAELTIGQHRDLSDDCPIKFTYRVEVSEGDEILNYSAEACKCFLHLLRTDLVDNLQKLREQPSACSTTAPSITGADLEIAPMLETPPRSEVVHASATSTVRARTPKHTIPQHSKVNRKLSHPFKSIGLVKQQQQHHQQQQPLVSVEQKQSTSLPQRLDSVKIQTPSHSSPTQSKRVVVVTSNSATPPSTTTTMNSSQQAESSNAFMQQVSKLVSKGRQHKVVARCYDSNSPVFPVVPAVPTPSSPVSTSAMSTIVGATPLEPEQASTSEFKPPAVSIVPPCSLTSEGLPSSVQLNNGGVQMDPLIGEAILSRNGSSDSHTVLSPTFLLPGQSLSDLSLTGLMYGADSVSGTGYRFIESQGDDRFTCLNGNCLDTPKKLL